MKKISILAVSVMLLLCNLQTISANEVILYTEETPISVSIDGTDQTLPDQPGNDVIVDEGDLDNQQTNPEMNVPLTGVMANGLYASLIVLLISLVWLENTDIHILKRNDFNA